MNVLRYLLVAPSTAQRTAQHSTVFSLGTLLRSPLTEIAAALHRDPHV